MIWLIGAIITGVIALVLFKNFKSQASSVRYATKDAQRRARNLTIEEQTNFSTDIRELALEQYDMASRDAIQNGKSENFSHQVGIFRAVNAVLTLGAQLNRRDEEEIQWETVPFNKLESIEGRSAIAEYLVYKFFPESADTGKFEPALRRFKAEMIAASTEDENPNHFLLSMIYCLNFDWQRYIAANIKD